MWRNYSKNKNLQPSCVHYVTSRLTTISNYALPVWLVSSWWVSASGIVRIYRTGKTPTSCSYFLGSVPRCSVEILLVFYCGYELVSSSSFLCWPYRIFPPQFALCSTGQCNWACCFHQQSTITFPSALPRTASASRVSCVRLCGILFARSFFFLRRALTAKSSVNGSNIY